MLDVLPLLGWPPLQEADCAFGLICPRRLGAIITDQSPASLEPEYDSLCILADANSICLTTTALLARPDYAQKPHFESWSI